MEEWKMNRKSTAGVRGALLASATTVAFVVAAGCGGGGGGTNPLTPQLFRGVGPDATTALNSMRSAIGGANNGGAPLGTPTPNVGRREINWDAVLMDGTDFSNTVVVQAGNVVAIPFTRFQARGIVTSEFTAVSSNGFSTVSTGSAGKFPAFSGTNTFGPFNEAVKNTRFRVNFVEPTVAGTTAPARGVRGFGVIFLDVNREGSATVEYFSGTTSLGKFNALASATPGQPSFVGALFNQPFVTSVEIIAGDDVLFGFVGGLSNGPAEALPNKDIVALDDFIFSEPATAAPLP
jgi:hypothetical protein